MSSQTFSFKCDMCDTRYNLYRSVPKDGNMTKNITNNHACNHIMVKQCYGCCHQFYTTFSEATCCKNCINKKTTCTVCKAVAFDEFCTSCHNIKSIVLVARVCHTISHCSTIQMIWRLHTMLSRRIMMVIVQIMVLSRQTSVL